ncbi:MAG: isoprenylcysteine carboxylmethyltransferase family protein [candidate division WOR-3 bacterium]
MKIGRWLFRNRGWLGAPFFLVALVFGRYSPILLGIGVGLTAMGELARWASVAFSGATTRSSRIEAPRLVTEGPYAWTRNPIYWGNFLVGLGMTVSSAALFPWLAIAFAVLFWAEYALIILAEEDYLKGEFGQEFTDYCRRTRRFLILPRKTSWRGGKWRAALRSERSTLLVIMGFYILLGLRLLL